MKTKTFYFILPFVLLSLSSLLSYEKINHLDSGVKYNLLPANLVLEFFIIVIFLTVFSQLKHNRFWFYPVWISIFYMFYGIVYYFLDVHSAKIIDFFLIYKPFFYVIVLSFVFNKKTFSETFLKRFYIFISIVFLIKYLVSIFIFDINRPGVFTENNFEMMFIGLLFLSTYDRKGEFSSLNFLIFAIISFLSLSKSAVIFTLLVFVLIKFSGLLRNKITKTALVIILFLLVLAVVSLRLDSSSIESVDRYIFFLNFLYEMDLSRWYRWIIGHSPLTPVSYSTALSMEYYHLVFSDHDNLIAFSPIFHSFLLRMIFDHGLVGLIFIVLFNYFLVLKSTNFNHVAYASTVILVVNGLSVSSFQSIYFLFGTLFLILKKSK